MVHFVADLNCLFSRNKRRGKAKTAASQSILRALLIPPHEKREDLYSSAQV